MFRLRDLWRRSTRSPIVSAGYGHVPAGRVAALAVPFVQRDGEPPVVPVRWLRRTKDSELLDERCRLRFAAFATVLVDALARQIETASSFSVDVVRAAPAQGSSMPTVNALCPRASTLRTGGYTTFVPAGGDVVRLTALKPLPEAQSGAAVHLLVVDADWWDEHSSWLHHLSVAQRPERLRVRIEVTSGSWDTAAGGPRRPVVASAVRPRRSVI